MAGITLLDKRRLRHIGNIKIGIHAFNTKFESLHIMGNRKFVVLTGETGGQNLQTSFTQVTICELN
jgi:hypothetical protein